MNAKELAQLLSGREYSKEITDSEESQAKDSGLVVVFGYSDDGTEFRGAIRDELGAWEGQTHYLGRDGLLENKCDDDDCPYFAEERRSAIELEALWCPAGKAAGKEDHKLDGYCWEFKTDIPHETFMVMDEGEKFCLGIVFSMDDLKATWDAKQKAR